MTIEGNVDEGDRRKEAIESRFSSLRDLSPEELGVSAELVDLAMRQVRESKLEKETGFKSVYLALGKQGDRGWLMIRDFNAGNEYANNDGGMYLAYRLNRDGKVVDGSFINLPRSRDRAIEENLSDLEAKSLDFSVVGDIVSGLKSDPRRVDEQEYEAAMRTPTAAPETLG